MPPSKANQPIQNAFTEIVAELVSATTDPTQYKPHGPLFRFDNEFQKVFVKMSVPTKAVLSDKMVGKGKERYRQIIVSVEGATLLLKSTATAMMATTIQG